MDAEPADKAIARLAERQHGVVARRQLERLGLGRGAIAHRIDVGRLHRLNRGVYAVGHRRLTLHGRLIAAALARKDHVVVGRGAATLHDLMRLGSAPIETERRSVDVVVVDGIPCTSVTRTIVDLATDPRLPSIVRQAERLRTLDAGAIRARLGRGVQGSATLRALLDEWRDDEDVRNDFEREFLEAIADARLPLPQCNVPYAGYVPDFRWPDRNLIVELDGWQDHGTKRNFEEDRRRDAKLLLLHQRVMRVTYRRFKRERRAVMADLAGLLDA